MLIRKFLQKFHKKKIFSYFSIFPAVPSLFSRAPSRYNECFLIFNNSSLFYSVLLVLLNYYVV